MISLLEMILFITWYMLAVFVVILFLLFLSHYPSLIVILFGVSLVIGILLFNEYMR